MHTFGKDFALSLNLVIWGITYMCTFADLIFKKIMQFIKVANEPWLSVIQLGHNWLILLFVAGEFNIKVTKVKQGEQFEGLDMLTKLMATPGSTSAKAPVIEVVGGSEEVDEEGNLDTLVEI